MSGQTAENATGQSQEDVRQLPGFWQDAEERIQSKDLRQNIIIVDRSVDKVYNAPPCNVQEISIDKLLPSEHYSRTEAFEREDSLKRLAVSIIAYGLHQLPRVKADPERQGYYRILDGHRRVEAVKEYLGWTSMHCKVYPADLDASWITFFEGVYNMARWRSYVAPFGSYEAGMFLRKLIDYDQDDEDAIAKEEQTVASNFGLELKCIQSWAETARQLEGSSKHLSYDEKQSFFLKLRNDQELVKLIERLETWDDAREAARRILKGATLKELKEFEKTCAKKHAQEAAAKEPDLSHAPEHEEEATEKQEEANPESTVKDRASVHEQVLELKAEGKSTRQIERKIGISRSMVSIIVKQHSEGTCSCHQAAS